MQIRIFCPVAQKIQNPLVNFDLDLNQTPTLLFDWNWFYFWTSECVGAIYEWIYTCKVVSKKSFLKLQSVTFLIKNDPKSIFEQVHNQSVFITSRL